jgi:hypothetical protein
MPLPKVGGTSGSMGEAKPRVIAYGDALETLRHDRDMARALVGVPLPVCFFCIFVAMLSRHIPTSELYEQSYSVSSVLDSAGTDALTPATTMKFQNIAETSDVFDWLIDTFVPSVFTTEDYNGKLLPKDQWGRIAHFNKVLGAVTFQVTRAPIHPCQAAQFLVDLYPNCYDAANTTTSTFLISFDTNATEAADIVSRLKDHGSWLDFATQQLLITVVAYNGEVQGFTVTKLQLDFHQGGYIETSSTTTPTISDPYTSEGAIVLDVLVGVCLALSLRRPLGAFLRALCSPRTWRVQLSECDFGSFVVSLAVSACTCAFYGIWISMIWLMYAREFRDNLARLVVSGKKFDASSNEREGLVAVTKSLERVAECTTALRLVATATVFALGIDILMQFRFHPRLNILTRTVANALHQFVGFFIVFVVIFMTFAVSGAVLFGDRVQGFASLAHAMESCVNMLFGNFDYATIQSVNAPVGMLYYWAYMVVVSLVLLNMMLAIVLDSYEEMSREAASSKNSVSLRRTISNALYERQLRVARLGRRSRIAQYASRSEVVFRGRIIPDVLERVLVETASGGSECRAEEDKVVSETTLVELFPNVKITTQEARATIAFLVAGSRASRGDGDSADARLPREETTREVAKAVDELVHESSDVTASRAKDQLLIARMEALERKLDLLLRQQ